MAEPADPHASSLRELIGQIFGRDTFSSERSRAVLDDLVTAGKLTREEADAVFEELQGRAGVLARLGERASDSLSAVADQLGLVRERRLEELELRLAQLEHRLRLLEHAADGQAEKPPLA
jgi:polyhydroxyalkanoate synthesis regulator phasin